MTHLVENFHGEELVAEPHTMLVLLNSRWEYSYTPSGESLALQTFMLTEPAIYCLEDADLGTSGGVLFFFFVFFWRVERC